LGKLSQLRYPPPLTLLQIAIEHPVHSHFIYIQFAYYYFCKLVHRQNNKYALYLTPNESQFKLTKLLTISIDGVSVLLKLKWLCRAQIAARNDNLWNGNPLNGRPLVVSRLVHVRQCRTKLTRSGEF